ncbi:MAG: acyl-CoA dehydrogenase, partial [Alphaproteobacteria bacterium]|nr:acyl-CoA dehydrogenase [Alphaproteobacteria bacterium]
LIGAAFSESSGGLGSSLRDLAIVSQAMGAGLVVEPLIDSAVLAGGLFEETAPEDIRNVWLPDLLSGKCRLALAHCEQAALGRINQIKTRADNPGDSFTLTGMKALVCQGLDAGGFIASASEGGALALFFVEAMAAGLTRTPYRIIDGSLAVQLTFNKTPARRLNGGLAELDAAQTRADLCHCAEALGMMDRVFNSTLEYLRTRKQFGAAIGSFQAIQHRMVAHYVALEQARGLLDRALIAADQSDPALAHTVAGARAFISEASVKLGHDAIQFHGGMGVSDELIIGHAHKRFVFLSRFPVPADVAADSYAGVNFSEANG